MIYLIRHGLDDETYIGGWSEVDLTDEGKKQVEESAKYIKKNLNISKLYSSDINRVVTTSKIISKEINIEPIHTSLLRELNKGDLTGLKKEDAKKRFPKYFENINIYTRYPNGESMLDFYIRVKLVLETILKLDNTLLATHRGVINMIYFIFNNRFPDMNKNQFGVSHASIHEIDKDKMQIRRIK